MTACLMIRGVYAYVEAKVHKGLHHSFLVKKREIEDIYFFEVNTKYISSNVLKILAISRVRSTSGIANIFNT